MAHPRHPRAPGERANLYEQITSRIIAELEAGRVPWVQPWSNSKAGIGMPHNAVSARNYGGVNILTLWNAVIERGFSSHAFLTFRQAIALGGSVRRGERGIGIIYTRRFIPGEERRRTESEGRAPSGGIPFLKWFTVFSVEQCDGLPAHISEPPPPVPDGLILPQAEALIAATGADFRIGGSSAFYSPAHDYVQVPRPDAFHDPVNWHRTAFHELGHWVGGGSRLNRDQTGAFGSVAYGKEELVAEMTGAFVCAALGIAPTVRHSDYIGSWLGIIREDHRAILRAASAASKAADYLLAFRPGATTAANDDDPDPDPDAACALAGEGRGMILVTPEIRAELEANDAAHRTAVARGMREPDPVPVVRFFNPLGQATWLATEIDPDGILFGLADLGFGTPELGSFALEELESIRLPFGLGIERDIRFEGSHPLSVYAKAARRAGSLVLAERALRKASATLRGGR